MPESPRPVFMLVMPVLVLLRPVPEVPMPMDEPEWPVLPMPPVAEQQLLSRVVLFR